MSSGKQAISWARGDQSLLICGLTGVNSSVSASNFLPARRHALPRDWRPCRRYRPPWPPWPSFRAFQALNRARFPCKASSTFSFHHQVSCLHLWFLERPQTLVAASSRGPFSFDQTVSTRFAASPATPALVAAKAEAVITFNVKAGWNWLAVIGSLSFQAQMLGKNLHF